MLFCGIVAAHYVRPNLSEHDRGRVGSFFKLLSTLAETYVFLLVGESLFLDQQSLSWSVLPFLVRLACLAPPPAGQDGRVPDCTCASASA